MSYVYNFLIETVQFFGGFSRLMSEKMRLFYKGRKGVLQAMDEWNPGKKVIWMHVASLGEYEQGQPLLEELKSHFSDYAILLSFFSPSGYEIKKNNTLADKTIYLPLDTKGNARRFLKSQDFAMAIFVKYELWPNFMFALKAQKIPALLISARFYQKHILFKPHGSLLRKAIGCFDTIFTQDENSQKQLKNFLPHLNAVQSSDTRYDRVVEIAAKRKELLWAQNFAQDDFTMVVGSSWPEEEELLLALLASTKLKIIIAPHQVNAKNINRITALFEAYKVQCLSKYKADEETRVLVVDEIGLLSSLYFYGNCAFIGGGFKTGLHNTLEAAVYAKPILIGPNYSAFPEVVDLVQNGGVQIVNNAKELENSIRQWMSDAKTTAYLGAKNYDRIQAKKGATLQILEKIKNTLDH
jgi:3-deoxy-D-manno-octulosonic-acid transferase